MIKTSDSHPIYIDFIDFKWSENGNKFGITIAPGKDQPHGWTGTWKRNLVQDLHRISS